MRFTKTLAIATVFVMGACGDDSTGDAGDLSSSESQALAAAVIQVALSEGLSAAFGGGGAVPIDISQSVDVNAPCPEGGTVQLSLDMDGSIDSDTGDMDIEMDIVQVHQACVVTSGGHEFVFDGAPNITMEYDIMSSGGNVSMDGSYSGAVDWELDGRSGTCSLNVEFSASGSQAASNVSISGSVCGESFSG